MKSLLQACPNLQPWRAVNEQEWGSIILQDAQELRNGQKGEVGTLDGFLFVHKTLLAFRVQCLQWAKGHSYSDHCRRRGRVPAGKFFARLLSQWILRRENEMQMEVAKSVHHKLQTPACGLALPLQSFQSFQVSRHTVYPQSWATQRIFRVFMSFEPMESDRTIPFNGDQGANSSAGGSQWGYLWFGRDGWGSIYVLFYIPWYFVIQVLIWPEKIPKTRFGFIHCHFSTRS